MGGSRRGIVEVVDGAVLVARYVVDDFCHRYAVVRDATDCGAACPYDHQLLVESIAGVGERDGGEACRVLAHY